MRARGRATRCGRSRGGVPSVPIDVPALEKVDGDALDAAGVAALAGADAVIQSLGAPKRAAAIFAARPCSRGRRASWSMPCAKGPRRS